MFKNKKIFTWLSILFFLLVLFIVTGLLLVSYTAGFALFSGVILGWLVKKYFIANGKKTNYFRLLKIFFPKLIFHLSLLLLARLTILLLLFIWLPVGIILIVYTTIYACLTFLERISKNVVLFQSFRETQPNLPLNNKIIRLFIFYLLVGLLLNSLTLISQDPCPNCLIRVSNYIDSYRITINPVSNNLKQFKIDEKFKFNDKVLSLLASKYNTQLNENNISKLFNPTQTKYVSTTNQGFILKKVYIAPLNLDSDGYINLKFGNKIFREKNCTWYCPKYTDYRIELLDFPTGSFYQAQGAKDLIIDSFVNIETISWSISSLEKEIRFAYIPPPYYYLRSILRPFANFAYTNKWIIVAVGAIVTFVFTFKSKQIINVSSIATVESKHMSEAFKYDMRGSNFSGGFAETNYGKMVETQHNYATSPNIGESAIKIVLILASNPKTTSSLRLDEEVREIDAGLQRAKKREQFDLKQRWAVRVRDVYQALLDFKPQFVHFSGHGTGDDGLVMEDETGLVQLVNTEALTELFKLFASHVECILLNACYSEVQAEAIVKHIPYVIGMNNMIGDKAAIKFAIAFYNALGAGESVEFAYKLGCNVIQLDGIPEHLTPVLKKKV